MWTPIKPKRVNLYRHQRILCVLEKFSLSRLLVQKRSSNSSPGSTTSSRRSVGRWRMMSRSQAEFFSPQTQRFRAQSRLFCRPFLSFLRRGSVVAHYIPRVASATATMRCWGERIPNFTPWRARDYIITWQ